MSGYPRLSFLHFNEIYHDPVNLWTSDKSSCEFRAYHARCVHDLLHLHFCSVKSALIAKTLYLTPNVHAGVVIAMLRQQHFAKVKTA